MENGKKLAFGMTAVLLIAVGVRVGMIYKANHEEAPPPKDAWVKPKLSGDDMVFIRKQHPDTLKDERALIGTTVWVSAGGQLDYYHYANHHADYARPVSTLPGAEPLLVKDVFEQVPPKGRAVMRIAAGQRHVLLAFTMPKSADPKTLYAVPIGNYANGGYGILSDDIFFYDDPHALYKHWGADTWAHIDKHEVVPGMSENQAMMALGQVLTPSGDSVGDRAITYDNNGHPMRVVFANDKAVSVTPDQ
ncbi:MAG: hypothetical protein ABI291_02305 [Acidobacteriaceae bacterium]